MSEEQAGPFQNWKQVVVAAILAFVVPVFLIIAVVQLITGGMRTGNTSGMNEEAVARRIKPVGEVNLVPAAAPAGERSGEQVYQSTCSECHAAGLLNAPKPGDKAAWAARIAQGEKTLVAHAINGIRQMPPRGGNASLSEAEVERAVIWMANQSGANFKEPAAPPPPAQQASASSPAASGAPASAANSPPGSPAAAPMAAPSGKTTAAASATVSGEQVFEQSCAMCHAAGIAGAPKVGDVTAWKPRLAQGKPTLYQHALKGIRAMPPKGGNAALPDTEVKAAVDYMVSQV